MFPNPFSLRRPPWGKLKLIRDKHAVIILDNKQIHLDSLSKRITGKVAYVGGLYEKSFSKFCSLVAAERLDLYDMRVADISALADMPRLRHLAIRCSTIELLHHQTLLPFLLNRRNCASNIRYK